MASLTNQQCAERAAEALDGKYLNWIALGYPDNVPVGLLSSITTIILDAYKPLEGELRMAERRAKDYSQETRKLNTKIEKLKVRLGDAPVMIDLLARLIHDAAANHVTASWRNCSVPMCKKCQEIVAGEKFDWTDYFAEARTCYHDRIVELEKQLAAKDERIRVLEKALDNAISTLEPFAKDLPCTQLLITHIKAAREAIEKKEGEKDGDESRD